MPLFLVAHELRNELEFAFAVLEPGDRSQKITRIRQSVRSDGSKIRQPEQRAVVLAHVPTRGLVQQLDAESETAWQHDNFLRFHVNDPELRGKAQSALLRHNQHLTIRVVKVPALHGTVCGIQVYTAAALRFRRAVASESD